MVTAKTHEPPKLNRRYACIVDREATTLAALISSYLFVPGTYFPLFLLRRVHVAQTDEEIGFMSEAYVAELMAGQDSVFIGNALGRLGAPQYLILAGLNEAQKSYLRLPKGSTVVEIADASEVESKLLHLTDIREELKCKAEDILSGLVVAQRLRRRLILDQNAPPLPEIVQLQNAAVVAEQLDDPATVVAINYGNAVNASVLLVDSLVKNDARQVLNWIQDWKEKGNAEAYRKIKEEVERRSARFHLGSLSMQHFSQPGYLTP